MTIDATPAPVRVTAPDRHFRTDHLLADLKERSVRGGAVTVGAQAAKFALHLGSTAVLARLLMPGDFGLIAMVTVVTGFVALFKDAGLSMATVQRREITHQQVSVLFWINLALSVAVMLTVAALSPALAWLYGEPRLLAIGLVLSMTFVFGGLTVQHEALLKRQMRFKTLAVIDIASMTSGVITAVLMAADGWGYWALVGLTAGTAVVNCVLVWACSGWIPGRPARGTGVRPMLAFGGNLVGAGMLNHIAKNADNFLIGYFAGPAALGIYSRAYALVLLPLRQVLAPISAPVTAALSRVAHAPEKFRETFFPNAEIVFSGAMLIVAFCFAAAPEIVRLLLGPGWEEAAAIFRYLAPGAFIQATNVSGGWVCTSLGRTERQLRFALVSTPVYLIAYAIGIAWGAAGVAIAFSAATLAMRAPAFHYLLRGSPITPRDLFAIAARPFAVAAAGIAAALSIEWLMAGSWWQLLCAKALAFGVAVVLGEAVGLLRIRRIAAALLHRGERSQIIAAMK